MIGPFVSFLCGYPLIDTVITRICEIKTVNYYKVIVVDTNQ